VAQKGKEDLATLSESASLETVISSRRSALDYVDKSISLSQFVHIQPVHPFSPLPSSRKMAQKGNEKRRATFAHLLKSASPNRYIHSSL
jgi:hypothetical protein